MKKTIAVLVGSLRKDSYNLKLAKVLQQIAPPSLELKLIKIDDLPFYNEDIDTNTPPASYTRFRTELAACQGAIFVSPEYNRSFPAVIKNALDVGSRPYGKSIWAKKPAAIMTASMGGPGGFGANHHLRQPLVFLDMPTLQQPEVYFGQVHTAFDDQGKLAEKSKEFLKQFIDAYAAWVEKVS